MPANPKQFVYRLSFPELGISYVAELAMAMVHPSPRHSHAEYQCLFFLDGALELRRQGRWRVQPAGSWCILPPGSEHAVRQHGRIDAPVYIDLHLLNGPEQALARVVGTLPPRGRAPVETLTGRAAALREGAGRVDAAQPARVMAAVWDLLAAVAEAAGTAPRSATAVDHRVLIAEGFMRRHLAETLTVEAVAREVRLSRSQLTRLFRSARGEGPHERLTALRLDKARHLLRVSALNIAEIAAVCGFVCPNHFSRVFRQHTGLPPTTWRDRRE